MTKPLAMVCAMVLTGFIALTSILAGRELIAPNVCESQLNTQIDVMLASDQPMENWQPDPSGLWGCSVLRDDQKRMVGQRVMTDRGPEIFMKAMQEAFE